MPTDKQRSKAKKGWKSTQQEGPSEEERKKESSKAAQAALSAQRQASELTKAAAGAGDPKERQKLLNEALQKEIEAESFGKTAKYLQSGTFQGLAAGAGIGVGTGAGLWTLTGTLVGGVTSLATGGLGAAVGSGVGALHGPFIKMGDVAGDAVAKVTGTLPGWEATEEQKKSLEKMIGHVNEQETPQSEELEAMRRGGDQRATAGSEAAKASNQKDGQGQTTSWGDHAPSYVPSKDSLPSMPSLGSKENSKPRVESKKRGTAKDRSDTQQKKNNEQDDGKGARAQDRSAQRSAGNRGTAESPATKAAASRTGKGAKQESEQPGQHVNGAQDKSKKCLESGVNKKGIAKENGTSRQSLEPKKKPRKLEVRSRPPQSEKDQDRKVRA